MEPSPRPGSLHNACNMKQRVPVRYACSGERTRDLEYPAKPDVRKAYRAAAKAYKEGLKQKVKAEELPDKALAPLTGAVPDELPERETFRVGLSARPRTLTLLDEKSGASHNFKAAD